MRSISSLNSLFSLKELHLSYEKIKETHKKPIVSEAVR